MKYRIVSRNQVHVDKPKPSLNPQKACKISKQSTPSIDYIDAGNGLYKINTNGSQNSKSSGHSSKGSKSSRRSLKSGSRKSHNSGQSNHSSKHSSQSNHSSNYSDESLPKSFTYKSEDSKSQALSFQSASESQSINLAEYNPAHQVPISMTRNMPEVQQHSLRNHNRAKRYEIIGVSNAVTLMLQRTPDQSVRTITTDSMANPIINVLLLPY